MLCIYYNTYKDVCLYILFHFINENDTNRLLLKHGNDEQKMRGEINALKYAIN